MPRPFFGFRTSFLILVASILSPVGATLIKPRDNIVIFGDSITADGAYGQIMQDLIDEALPDYFVRIITRGLHGDTARGGYARMELDVVRWRPDWVVINFGVNDAGRFTVEEFLAHYERLLNRMQRDTRAEIVIASPIYPDREVENPRLLDYVSGLQALAKKYHTAYAPVYEETRRLRATLPSGVRYAVDGSHPNDIGHWIFAQTILSALKFPHVGDAHRVEIPARRTVVDQRDSLAGTRFLLDLPMPVEVLLTAPPAPQAIARKATDPVIIDGVLSEWDLSRPITLGAPHQLNWSTVSWKRDHHAARAWLSWDDKALYFAIQVYDSQVRNDPNATNVVDRDCIEFAIDARAHASREETPYVSLVKKIPYVAQYIFAPAADGVKTATVAVGSGDQAMGQDVVVASTLTPSGYQLEASIPVARFQSGRLAAGDTFHIDITTINLDRGDRYLDNTSFRWTGSKWSAFNTREYGQLILHER